MTKNNNKKQQNKKEAIKRYDFKKVIYAIYYIIK